MKLSRKSSLLVGMSALILSTLSCSKVNFSSDTKSDSEPVPPGPVDPQSNSISCKVYLNDNLQSVNVQLPDGPNPKVIAKCTPAAVTYTWSVKKGPSAVTVNGLQGPESTADVKSLGEGTYKISLRATAQSYTDFTNENSPLSVTVLAAPTPQPPPKVNCDPKINGNLKKFTMSSGGPNPQIAANCTPPDASCVWTVTSGGKPVAVANLTTCTATPDFTNQPPGDYNIDLTAPRPGHTTYTLPEPLVVTVPPKPTRSVTTTKLVTNQDNQLDVQLIIDDSKSMLADNQKLASRMQGFVNDLTAAGFDWQMCATVTRAQQLDPNDATLYWGASNYWVGVGGATPYILKPGAANTFQIFQDTINQIGAGWAGTDDERAIKAAWWHLWNGDVRYAEASGCYRKDAGLATIILSDEDERSVGGDASQEFYAGENKPLEIDDMPQNYIDLVKDVFGATKRFAANSIIVRPGDTGCMAQQDAEGSKSHYGVKYNELSTLTGGSVGSICDSDYSTQLKYFKDQIVREMASLPLECTPIGAVKVSFDPAFTSTTRVENKTLYFDPKIPAGRTIKAEYQCPQ